MLVGYDWGLAEYQTTVALSSVEPGTNMLVADQLTAEKGMETITWS